MIHKPYLGSGGKGERPKSVDSVKRKDRKLWHQGKGDSRIGMLYVGRQNPRRKTEIRFAGGGEKIRGESWGRR